MAQKKRNIVGPQVRRLRAQAGWTQQQFAVRLQLAGLDWDRVAVAKVESRIKKVSDAELFIVATSLGVGMGVLFPAAERVKRFVASQG